MGLSITMPERTKSQKVKKAVKFSKWLKRHIDRDDPIGDLARDLYDRGPMQRVPLEASDDVYTFLEALEGASACTGALTAALSAWAEYVSDFPIKKRPLYCDFCRKAMTRADSEFWFRSPWEWASGFSHSRCVDEKIRAESRGDSDDYLDARICVQLAYDPLFGQIQPLPGTLTRIRLSDPMFHEKLEDFGPTVVQYFRAEGVGASADTRHFAEDKVRQVLELLALSRILDEPLRLASSGEESSEDATPSCVYFIRQGDDGPIKIGFATNPAKRKRQLQTSVADTLHTLLTLPGTRATEAHFHERFADLRLRGEWFRPDPVLLDFIQQARSSGQDVWS